MKSGDGAKPTHRAHGEQDQRYRGRAMFWTLVCERDGGNRGHDLGRQRRGIEERHGAFSEGRLGSDR